VTGIWICAAVHGLKAAGILMAVSIAGDVKERAEMQADKQPAFSFIPSVYGPLLRVPSIFSAPFYFGVKSGLPRLTPCPA
jgi:hypothetical protein